ncbi:MAG: pilin [Patescibacteria group bacterium]
MMKKIPRIIKIIFTLIFVFQLIGLAVLFALPEIIHAADINFKPQITIPGFDTEAKNAGMSGSETDGYSINGNSIGVLIKSIYKYAIGVVGILATIVMMIGGFMWLIAGGNQSKISEAQEWIKASLTGLVLALGSYMILATINPALVTFKKLDIKTIYELGCCDNLGGSVYKNTCTASGAWHSGTDYTYNSSTKKCEKTTGACLTYDSNKTEFTGCSNKTSTTCSGSDNQFCGNYTSCSNSKQSNGYYKCTSSSSTIKGCCLSNSNYSKYFSCDNITESECKGKTTPSGYVGEKFESGKECFKNISYRECK